MRKSDDNVNHSGRGLEDDVFDLVHRLLHQYRSLQYQVLRDGPHEITHMESKVLNYFDHHPGSTQSELAQHSGRDKAQLARLIKGLRDKGLLHGEAGEVDRRSVQLVLTDAGQALLRGLQQQGRRVNSRAVSGLSAAEQRQLVALLQRVKANLDEAD